MKIELRVYYDSSAGVFREGGGPGSIVVEYDDETAVVELGAIVSVTPINIASEDAYVTRLGVTDDQWGKYPPGVWQSDEDGEKGYRVIENPANGKPTGCTNCFGRGIIGCHPDVCDCDTAEECDRCGGTGYERAETTKAPQP